MDGIYHVYTIYIPWIYQGYTCISYVYRHIPKIQPGHHVLSSIISIYHGYTMHIQDIYMYIQDIYMYILMKYQLLISVYTAWNILINYLKYILTKIFWYTMYMLCIYHTYVMYIPCIYCLKYFDIRLKYFDILTEIL